MVPTSNGARRARRAGMLLALATGALGLASGTAWSGGGPGPLAVDDPVTIYDLAANAPYSLVAGTTDYLIRGDLNGDGMTDVVNVTKFGAQVFLNGGTPGSGLLMTLAQEFSVRHSYGGGAEDVDGDGDLDLVLGDQDSVVIALNDGTGQFVPTRPVNHRFHLPTIAVPFRAQPDGKLRVALCAAAESVDQDAIQPNPLRRPRLYILEQTPHGGWAHFQTLTIFNCGGVTTGDFDGDGATDVVATNRTYYGGQTPVMAWRSTGAGLPYEQVPLDFTGTGYGFAYRPALSPSGDLAAGAWHLTSVFDRGPAGWGWPRNVNVGPYGTGECWALGFADMNCDGAQDLVHAGKFSPVTLARLDGDPNDPAFRYTAGAHPGTSTALSLADWDADWDHVPDVIVGGSAGLFYLGNVNKGVTPPPVPPPFASDDRLLEAYFALTTLLDPTRAPPLETVEARFYAALCQTYLDFMRPGYLRDGTLDGATNAEKVAFLQGIYDSVHLCDYYLYIAKLWAVGEPEDVATIVAIRGKLADASIALLDEAIWFGGAITELPPNPTKARRRRDSTKGAKALYRLVLADRDAARQYAARARMETDPGRIDWYQRRTVDLTHRAGERLARVWNLMGI